MNEDPRDRRDRPQTGGVHRWAGECHETRFVTGGAGA